jgi:hypothetical protein
MKPFSAIASVIFAIVAILHALRLIYGWEFTINGVIIPMWVSVLGFIIPALLAILLWRESRR